jgi:Na+-driven multidrug efflux pump
VICIFIPGAAVRLFTNDPELIRLSTHGLRVMNCCFAVVGFGMVSGNFFQCLGMVKKSIFLSLTRQLLILVPLIYLLPLWLQETGVWISFPISDVASSVIALFFIIALFKKFDQLKDGDDPSLIGSSIR